MDAFAVSIAGGISVGHLPPGKNLLIASSLAGFQAVMPIVGWLGGIGLGYITEGLDHWIAFILLSLIGSKMIAEATRNDTLAFNPLSPGTLILLSIATSIDALTAGVTFPFMKISIPLTIVLIGLVTFSLSFVGLHIGKSLGKMMEALAEFAGGLILIAIAIRTLLLHVLYA